MRCSNRLCLQLRARLLFVLFVFIYVWWCLMHVASSFGLFILYCLFGILLRLFILPANPEKQTDHHYHNS